MAARRQNRPRTRAAVVPLPRRSGGSFLHRLARFLPSGPSLLVGFTLVALASGAYWGARATAVFAVQEIQVRGASPAEAARIRAALRPVRGTSLITLTPDEIEQPVAALPDVASVSYDRAFPHTVVVTVRIEQSAAVVRRGQESWLVSVRGRVLRRLDGRVHPELPRVWVPPAARLVPGGYVGDPAADRAIRVAATLRTDGIQLPVRTIRDDRGELAVRLSSGLDVRLGNGADLALKLAVAARIAGDLAPAWEGGPAFLDVSVPERPVVIESLNSEVEPES